MRIGQGYDVHCLVEGRKLILGGVEIPFERGLLGHSDADVLVHAVMDALLGAAALGDIGQHFPDSNPRYKGISSIALLKEVGCLLTKSHYPEAKACGLPSADGGKYCRSIGNTAKPGQCKGNDRRRSGIYRAGRRNQRTGHCLIDRRGRLLLLWF